MAWFVSRVTSRVLRFGKRHGCAFVIGFVFAMLCFIALNAMMKPLSRSGYCGGKCHEMKTAYQSWELSVHGANKSGIRVECVDCHLPSREKYFAHVVAKAYNRIFPAVLLRLTLQPREIEGIVQPAVCQVYDAIWRLRRRPV